MQSEAVAGLFFLGLGWQLHQHRASSIDFICIEQAAMSSSVSDPRQLPLSPQELDQIADAIGCPDPGMGGNGQQEGAEGVPQHRQSADYGGGRQSPSTATAPAAVPPSPAVHGPVYISHREVNESSGLKVGRRGHGGSGHSYVKRFYLVDNHGKGGGGGG